MGNTHTQAVVTCPKHSSSTLTDDELLAEIKKQIDEQIELNLIELKIESPATHEYYRRYRLPTGHINLDRIKQIINTYKKPYIFSMGPFRSFIIHFVVFPENS